MAPYSNLLDGNKEEDDLECPSLTYTQRIIGFGCCLGLGGLLSILSWVVLFQENYMMFGILNTLGNIFSIGSSFFLAGPKKQFKKMVDKTRIIATLIVLVMMIMTFISALVLKIAWLTIIFCILQYIALIWYGLSFIPFARDIVIKTVTGICGSVAAGGK